MTQVTTKPDWGDNLIIGDSATREFQNFLDDIEDRLNRFLLGDRLVLPSYPVSSLPNAAGAPGLIYVNDAAGGPVPAYNDGTDWRRVSDGAIVS